jgi:hypothetical protein
MKAVLEKDGVPLIESVEIADDFWGRLVGLMGRRSIGPGRALYVTPCGSLHTLLMRFNMDAIFLDDEYTVVKIVREITPFRLVFGGPDARSVVEVMSGWLSDDRIKVGDQVKLTRIE